MTPAPYVLGDRAVCEDQPCGARWYGREVVHCGDEPPHGCHLTFSDLGAFDRHRPEGRCLEPDAVNLTPVQHLWGICWTPTTTRSQP